MNALQGRLILEGHYASPRGIMRIDSFRCEPLSEPSDANPSYGNASRAPVGPLGLGYQEKDVIVNVGRGLFQAWILLTVIWLIGVGTMGYGLVPDEVGRWKWQYVHVMRPEIDLQKTDWTRPYYENMRSPSIEKLAVEFSKLDYEYVESWDKLAKDGKMNIVSFPDRSALYLDAHLTKDDQEYLSGAFWDQRWRRYWRIAGTWAAIAVAPAIVMLIIGWSLLWVARGFKTQ